MTFYIDGVLANQLATATDYLTAPLYIMIDYALGGGWPLTGMVNNSHLDVDWVRVYQLPAPNLTFQTAGSKLILNWPYGTLGQATNLLGPWLPLTGAHAPSYTNVISPSAPQMFFRTTLLP